MTVQWILTVNEGTGLQMTGIVGRGVRVARIYHNMPWASTVTLMVYLPDAVKRSTHATLQDAQDSGAKRIAAWFTEAMEAMDA